MCYEKRDTEQARACFERDQRGEKMAEYIEREALLKVLRGSAVAKYPASFAMGLFAAADEVSKLPAADVQTVVHSHWVHDSNNLYGCYRCMERETMSPKKLKPYCPNCGAHMKDGE